MLCFDTTHLLNTSQSALWVLFLVFILLRLNFIIINIVDGKCIYIDICLYNYCN